MVPAMVAGLSTFSVSWIQCKILAGTYASKQCHRTGLKRASGRQLSQSMRIGDMKMHEDALALGAWRLSCDG